MADIELLDRPAQLAERPTSITADQDTASALPLPASAASSLEQLRIHHVNPPSRACSTISTANVSLPESTFSTRQSSLILCGGDSRLGSLQNSANAARSAGSTANSPGSVQSPSTVRRDSSSTGSTVSRPASPPRRRRRRPRIWSYITRVEPLLRSMPHLDFVKRLRECRNDQAGEVFSIDIFEQPNIPASVRVDLVDQSGNFATQQLRDLDAIADDEVITRLIIVDDLSPTLVCSLGSVFRVDQELFAAHFHRSRCFKDSAVEHRESQWTTAALTKSFATVQWYRPVNLSGTVARWLDNGKQRRALFAGGTYDEAREETVPPIMWSETRFEQSNQRLHVYSAMSVKSIVQSTITHRIHLLSNIFRQSWLLSAKPATDFESRVPMAWEEKASIYMVEGSAVPTVVLLVDPMPSILDQQKHEETRLSISPVPRKRTFVMGESVSIPVFLPPDIRQPGDLPVNKLDATDEQLDRFRLAAEPASTAQAITSWLTTPGATADPIVALLEVVYRDSIGFFDSLETCLREISEDSLDDYLMSRRLSEWRRLMNDFEISVAEINNSLHTFVAFAFKSYAKRPDRVESMLADLDARNARFSQRIEKAYNALRAEMGVFESRRSIAEAETVTKLTELAFLFIPLTFCCGLYSMQVNELRDGVPLTTFVITAVIVFVICYGARLVLRSTIVTESGQTAKEILWAQGRIKPGTSIPARQFVWLTMREAWKRGGKSVTYLIFLLTTALTAVPVAFLWRQNHMDYGLNAMITVLFMPFGLVMAWFFATAYRDEAGPQRPLATWLFLMLSNILSEQRQESRPSSWRTAASSTPGRAATSSTSSVTA